MWASLFTVQLEADAPGLASGQGGGRCPWALALHLTGAPGAKQLALLAEEVHRAGPAVAALGQGSPGGSRGGVRVGACLQLAQVGHVAV